MTSQSMNKTLSLALLGLLVAHLLFAQAPNKMSYQAVLRNASNALLSNQNIGMRISILQGSANGTSVYTETQTTTTDANGLASVEIGGGSVLSGNFAGINWANGPYFIKTETDPAGGTSYSITSTQQLLSVPYALYAANSGSSTPGPPGPAGADGAPGPQGVQGATGATGPQGPQGATGTAGTNGNNGADGKTVLNGTTNPTTLIGNNGDFYINTSTNTIFGPKASGAWPANGVSLVGPQGATGATGATGPQGPAGLTGPTGPQGPAGNGYSNGTSANQMMYWNGTSWVTLNPGSDGQTLTICNGSLTWTTGGQCPGSITSLSCATATNSGTLTSGTSASGVSSSIPYSGGNGGIHNGQTVSSTGVTGLTATLASGTFANGAGDATYTITGTPGSSGTASFALNIGGQTCTLSRTVNNGGSSASCGATNVHNPNLTYGSMTDQEGNVYKTIVIGTQEWMAENLKASHYSNGDFIPVVSDPNTWAGLSNGATCWYNNDNATYNCPYGNLYNWFAVADPRNVCPTGWHVPTDAEWNVLTKQLDPAADTTCSNCTQSTIAGGKMKSTGTQYWLSPNTAADNSSGFSGLPGGNRDLIGGYNLIGYIGYWWSSSLTTAGNAWSRSLNAGSGSLDRYNGNKTNGFSVRCLRD